MKGEIEIKLTHETIIAAVQLYFSTQFQEGKVPVVASVSKDQYKEEFVVKANPPIQGESNAN